VIEYLWSRGDLFWHFLAFSQSPHNLGVLQLIRFSGFSTVTAVIVLVNGCFSEWLIDYSGKYVKDQTKDDRQDQRKKISNHNFLVLGIVIFIIAHLLGFLTLKTVDITTEEAAKIGIIQGNIPNEIKLYENGTSKAIANYTKGYQSLTNQAIDLVVTPETALPFKIEQVIAWTDFYRVVLREKIPVLLGAFGTEDKNFTNSLFLIGSQGEIMSRYNKQQLVPLGEYIPFEAVLGKFIDRLSPLDAHLVRGVNPPTVNTPIGRATVAICYESAYPEHFRRQTAAGGKFIVVSSNDAHYSATMPAQHHALDVMQAIANDRWTVRASNTGYSAIVTPTGATQWLSNLNEYAVHARTIYLRSTMTPYVRYGNWLIPLNLVLILLLSIYWKTR
jgi:apolipoprotein N-acyltransferase